MLTKRDKYMMVDIFGILGMLIIWRAEILPLWIATFFIGSFTTSFLFTFADKIQFK